MKKINLKDGSFPNSKSATLAGDNQDSVPVHFQWGRNNSRSSVTFFTDICLEQAKTDMSAKKIAWLIEPEEISPVHYNFALSHEYLFDYILTWNKKYLEVSDKWLFYPFGGSWIKKWGLYQPKSKFCSIIVSDKDKTEGHKLRHQIVKEFGDRIDVFGTGYQPIKSKLEALASYAYSIVVENVRADYWFTEKLIDCFSTGTIPIYWGCPSIEKFFSGVLWFNDLGGLSYILDYPEWKSVQDRDLEEAKKYRCVEDWLWKSYPFLFGLGD